jgi:transposase
LDMSSRNHLTEEFRWRAIGRLEAGQSQAEVARWLNVSRSVVPRLWNQFQQSQTASRRYSPGRPRITSARDDRYLRISALRNMRDTPTQLRYALSSSTGTLVSASTVRRRLHEGGLYARRPVVCVPLTPRHKRERLNWARLHVGWTQNQWRSILFTDESRFALQSDSRRILIWREKGTRYHPSNILERDAYGGGSVMVWAGVSLGGRTDLYLLPSGTMNGQRYRDEVLDPYVRPYAGAIGDTFILQDDNARPHRSRLVDQYLQENTIQRMEWPARSPDLNPIEHVWDALGRRIAALNPPPQNIQGLRRALEQQWSLLPTELLDTIINSMKHRCESCIAVRGDHTQY